jgi:hypothetical protein
MAEVEDSVKFADESPKPEMSQLLENVFADPRGFGIAPDGRYRCGGVGARGRGGAGPLHRRGMARVLNAPRRPASLASSLLPPRVCSPPHSPPLPRYELPGFTTGTAQVS